MKVTKARGRCDYCKKRRVLAPKSTFCRECLEEWNRVADKYLDGDPLTPLKAARALVEASRGDK